eukprot:6401640-Pyramimonas_sp.AAC.1
MSITSVGSSPPVGSSGGASARRATRTPAPAPTASPTVQAATAYAATMPAHEGSTTCPPAPAHTQDGQERVGGAGHAKCGEQDPQLGAEARATSEAPSACAPNLRTSAAWWARSCIPGQDT